MDWAELPQPKSPAQPGGPQAVFSSRVLGPWPVFRDSSEGNKGVTVLPEVDGTVRPFLNNVRVTCYSLLLPLSVSVPFYFTTSSLPPVQGSRPDARLVNLPAFRCFSLSGHKDVTT